MSDILQIRTCLGCGSTYRIIRGMLRTRWEVQDVLFVFPGNHEPGTHGFCHNRTSLDVIKCPICFSQVYHLEKGEESLPALDYIHCIPTNAERHRRRIVDGESEPESEMDEDPESSE